jgi:hypothetical protein
MKQEFTCELNLENLKVCYTRGNRIRFKNMSSPFEIDVNQGWEKYKLIYYENIDRILEHFLRKKSVFIGNWRSGLLNKILVLEEAKNVNLKVPKTLLCTSLNDIDSKKYVSKSFGITFRGEIDNYIVTSYTERLNKTSLGLNDTFMTSSIQKEIIKKVEIRVFVFLDTILSMAIFSQMNEKSKVDYRHYDLDSPYLNEPYKLPFRIECKIRKLMKKLKLNTGSIDLILTEKNQYYFLEINPNGQFGYLCYVNGINPSKLICEKLLKYV